MCDMDAVEAFRKHALNPERPAMRGSHENGDIFFQHREACNKLLRRAARSRREVHGQGQRQAGHRLQAVQLLRRSRCRPHHRRHGLHLRRGRGSHRLPERPRREGRPCQGPPVPSRSCAEQAAGGHPRHRQEDCRSGPHQGARLAGRAAVSWTWSRALAKAGRNGVTVIGGRYGLGSKDTPPASVFAVYDELAKDEPQAASSPSASWTT